MAARFDPTSFLTDSDHVALNVAGSELFSLMSRSYDLPASWAAMVTREGGAQSVVSAGAVIDGGDADSVLFVRATPFEVSLNEQGLQTSDRFQCRADIRLQLSVIAERGELQSFAKAVLGSHRVVKVEGVARHIAPDVRAALASFVAEREMAVVLDAAKIDDATALVTEAVKRACFSAGLSLMDRPVVKFESVTFDRVRATQEDAARRRAEHQATRQVQQALEDAQSKHLDHLASLLKRLEKNAAESPDVELPELLRTFADDQRGELYQALFKTRITEARTRWIVVAAGDELLFFDPQHLDEPSRRLSVKGGVGPVRSVHQRSSPDGPVLMLGAARGVYRWPIDRAEPDLTLMVPDAPDVRGGFNSVAVLGDRVIATHSELGIVEWDVNDSSAARQRFESMTKVAKAVRCATVCDGDLLCSIDDRVIRWRGDEDGDVASAIYAGSGSTITAICPGSTELFAANSHGDVLHWPSGSTDDPRRLHHGSDRAAESLWLLETHGVRRIVFSDTSLEIRARVLGDTFSCSYGAGGQTLRRVEVAPDLLVATNDLRDRLFCWTPDEPGRPRTSIAVSSLCGRSVQDVCLVPFA